MHPPGASTHAAGVAEPARPAAPAGAPAGHVGKGFVVQYGPGAERLPSRARVNIATAAAATVPFDKEIDASGLACPLPIVRAKKALSAMASGQVLRVLGTDPGSVDDMPAFAEAGGHALLASTREDAREGGRFVFLIRKG